MTGFKSKKAAALDKLDRRGSIALARSLCYQINGAADDSDDMDGGGYGSVDIAEILSAEVVRLQAALAQPEQEPHSYCYVQRGTSVDILTFDDMPKDAIAGTIYPLYAAPPQRPWVGLTDNQIEQIYYDLVKIHRGAPMPWGQINFGKVLQAAIREANK